MAEDILISAVDLAVQAIEAANKASAFKKECDKVKMKVEKLLELLKKAVMASSNLCEFPTRHIVSIAKTVLQKSLSLLNKILEQGSMRVQAEVACTISVLVSSFPESQNVLAQHDVIQLLLRHLASQKTPKLEDSFHVKAMAAKALKELAKGNSTICKSITDSKRFLCFADLLEIEDKEVRYNSLLVLIEITAVAEQVSDLRHSAFKRKSPIFKAIVNQTHRLIEENGDTVLLIPYITLIGNLARAFRASDTSMIEQYVKLLGHQDPEVSKEAVLALTKFASPGNYLHKDHSKAVVEAGATRRLIELSSLGCEIRIPALELLICIAVYVPEKEQVMKVLECASKQPFSKS